MTYLAKKSKKTLQFTDKGMTMAELLEKAKPGDILHLVSDYAFGMPHDMWKIAKLTDLTYIIEKFNDKYTKDAIYMRIRSKEGKPYSIIGEPDWKTGFIL
jgi:hypothetical protein